MEPGAFTVRYDPLSALKHALYACVPSILQTRHHRKQEPQAHRLASLDGLRGVAAFIVFLCHLGWTYHPWIEYGLGDGPDNNRLIQFPIIRIVISGHAMVSLFFVVGGFVSSHSALRKARSHSYEKLYTSLASSLFRRGIRLYTPAIIATFIVMWAIILGAFEPARQYVDRPYIVNSDNHHRYLGSIGAQLENWFRETLGMMNIWDYYNHGFVQTYYNPYDPHLWTVPMEMRGGLVVTLALLAFSRCRVVARFALMGLSVVYCVYWDRWECMEFLLGSVAAEIDLIIQDRIPKTPDTGPVIINHDEHALEYRVDSPMSPIPSSSTSSPSSYDPFFLESEKPAWSRRQTAFSAARRSLRTLTRTLPTITPRTLIRPLLLALALYLLSAPNANFHTTTLYTALPRFTPSSISDPKRFFHGLGAFVLLLCLPSSPTLQKPFVHPIAQYLGRISYSFYIVHGPCIHMVGMWITPAIWERCGWEGMWGWGFGFVGGGFVVAAVVFVAADGFWRGVEGRCVGWARAVEGWCCG